MEILKVYTFDAAGGGYPLDIRVTEADATILNAEGDAIGSDTAQQLAP